MVLHVHSNCTDQLCLTEVRNEFIQDFNNQETLFGKFLPTDQTECYCFKPLYYLFDYAYSCNTLNECYKTIQ